MEVSLVTFPSNPDATVTDIRSKLASGALPQPKHIEKVLRDAGFSRTQAKTFMAKGYGSLAPRDAEKEAMKQLSNKINSWSFTHGL